MSDSPAYLNPALPLAERVQDLISGLTLEEKLAQLRNNAPAVPRLGLPAYNYWSEALHGVARNGRATVFPQAIGLAATWDVALVRRLASAIGDEGRAKYHETLRRQGQTSLCQGLTFWSPNVNIFRDPRWGRGQETYGEDPLLTGEIGGAFVRGLQGDDPRYLKAAACAKHFAVHSGPERLRHSFDAQVSLRDLHDTYLPAFKKLVTEAGVAAVMGAYNRVNGEPCCAQPYLVGQVLRQDWGFQGHLVSDCGAIGDIFSGHHSAADPAEAAALALRRGCDLECGDTFQHLGQALERGLVGQPEVDGALAGVLATRFRLGMFDPPEQVPYASTPMSVVGSRAHRRLAREAAVKSLVLLKNRGGLLPLGPEVRTIRLMGPTAADLNVLLGNYFGMNSPLATIVEGMAEQVPEGVTLEYRPGALLTQAATGQQDWLLDPANQPDVVVACMGLSPLLEGEEGDAIASAEDGDRSDLALPAAQAEFVRRLAATGVKIVLVLTGGSPIALGDLADLVDAILFVWYPGQEGGHAVADAVFGRVSPSGKLPITFPASVEQLPPFEDYSLRERTYRYMTSEPLYPFGFGLSYTRFTYSGLKLSRSRIQAGQSLVVRLTLSNTGAVAAEEVAQVYLSDLDATVTVPRHKLVAFRRVGLAPGQSRRLSFTLTPEMMSLVDEAGQQWMEAGEFRVTIGGCSPGARGLALGAPAPASAAFEVV